jgi:hypothetical protein
VVDQAVGVLIAVHGVAPAAGFEVLREVSQHSDAEALIGWALGQMLPEPVGRELGESV